MGKVVYYIGQVILNSISFINTIKIKSQIIRVGGYHDRSIKTLYNITAFLLICSNLPLLVTN